MKLPFILRSRVARIGELSYLIARRLYLKRSWTKREQKRHAADIAERDTILCDLHPPYGDVLDEARRRGLLDEAPNATPEYEHWAFDTERSRLREAVIVAARTFREYHQVHLDKLRSAPATDLLFIAECRRKAAANIAMAERLEASLVMDPQETK